MDKLFPLILLGVGAFLYLRNRRDDSVDEYDEPEPEFGDAYDEEYFSDDQTPKNRKSWLDGAVASNRKRFELAEKVGGKLVGPSGPKIATILRKKKKSRLSL